MNIFGKQNTLFTFGEAVLGLGVALMLPGSLIGGIVGGGSIDIPIGGKKENYEARKKELEKYLFELGGN